MAFIKWLIGGSHQHQNEEEKQRPYHFNEQPQLLSLPESEVLPQEQSELRQETHYGLSWQYPAKASLWQLAHLINPPSCLLFTHQHILGPKDGFDQF